MSNRNYSPRSPLWGRLAFGIGLVLVMSGCTPSGTTPDTSGAGAATETPEAVPADFLTAVAPSWSVAGSPIGLASAIDGFVVSYLDDGDSTLSVVVWDVATGAEVWRAPVVMGAAPGGMMASARVARSAEGAWYVVYLQETSGSLSDWRNLRVAELATGTLVHLSEKFSADTGEVEIYSTTIPAECADEKDICFTGSFPSGRLAYGAMRVNIATGEAGRDTQSFAPSNSRPLGQGVYSSNSRGNDADPEMLIVADESVALWSKPYAEVFGEGASSDAGWIWYAPADAEVIVGTGRIARAETSSTSDVGSWSTVGLDRVTGEQLWSIESTAATCAATAIGDDFITDVYPLCLANSGTVTYNEETGTSTVDNLDISMVGVDIKTGEIRWTIEAGSDPSLYGAFGEAASFGGGTPWRPVVVQGEPVLVDVLSGETQEIPDDALLDCTGDRAMFSTATSWTGELSTYVTGDNIFGCAIDRSPNAAFAMSPSGLVSSANPDEGDWWVVSGADGIRGYQSSEATAILEASTE